MKHLKEILNSKFKNYLSSSLKIYDSHIVVIVIVSNSSGSG